MKLDILVFAAHPDDAELGCGGTIIKHVEAGYKVGVIDFTRGELGTRGTPASRKDEADKSSKILGLSLRENLGLDDGFFTNDKLAQLEVVRMIRKYKPTIVLANATIDRHPDHGRASQLAFDSIFVSGLLKVETRDNGSIQETWKPDVLYHYIQSQFVEPDLVLDISAVWEKKMEAIHAFKSQFYDANSQEPQTYISKPGFLKMLEARAIELGHGIGVSHGEGFTTRRWLGVKSLLDLF